MLPDGRIELVAHRGARFHLLDDHGRATLQPRRLLVGLRVSELRDQIVALDDAWGAAARQWMEALGNTPGTAARISLTNAFLRAHLRTRPPEAPAAPRANWSAPY